MSVNNKFNWWLTLKISFVLFIIIIIVWFIFATNYRYSSDRISAQMRSKYTATLTDDQYLDVSNPYISGNIAFTTMEIHSKNDMSLIDATIFKLPIKDSCSPLDVTCVTF